MTHTLPIGSLYYKVSSLLLFTCSSFFASGTADSNSKNHNTAVGNSNIASSSKTKSEKSKGRTVMITTAHIITVVIGSGVLSLAWTTAQLGWIARLVALVAFSLIAWYSLLLADSYRAPDGSRNAIRSHLATESIHRFYLLSKSRNRGIRDLCLMVPKVIYPDFRFFFGRM